MNLLFRKSLFCINIYADKLSPIRFSASLLFRRNASDNNSGNSDPDFSSSSILVEKGYNVHELPVIIRRLKDVSEIDKHSAAEIVVHAHESQNYHLIQAEFKQCMDLRDVFTLLSKCTKITPNIALGAIERIYDLEKNPTAVSIQTQNLNTNMAKGAILEKLLKVVLKTEDTHTILNILKTESSFMQPYKYKFSDELLLRAADNKLTLQHLCEFISFLKSNKSDLKYSETIDKLWIGFSEQESEINEKNIAEIFKVLPALKSSKRTIMNLLEQKFSELWYKISITAMQDILTSFVQEKYFSVQLFPIVGSWLSLNIHALDEDSLLNIITKLIQLHYTDDRIEKALEKYMKLKGTKIVSYVLVVGILNYCTQFQIRSKIILDSCSDYFLRNGNKIPCSFLKSFIYPFGYLNYDPIKSVEFWKISEQLLDKNFHKISPSDMCLMVLSFIYNSIYPCQLVNRMCSAENFVKTSSTDTSKCLHLIDIALSLECEEYSGPLLPKDKWSKSISQDIRIKNIVSKIIESIITIAGGEDRFSTEVSVPHLYSHETYLIDVMLHPPGAGSNISNWKSKSDKNENVAVLIHLPDHYCSDGEHLIGPQMLRIKHLRLLGMKVASVRYSFLSKFYVTYNKNALDNYLTECVNNALHCL